MCRITLGVWLAIAGFLAHSSAIASESPLEGIPDTALVLVRLKSPDATIKKVADFAGRIKKEYPTPLIMAAFLRGALISNPAQAGVDRKRDWWLALTGGPGRALEVVLAIPTADEKAMKDALGGRGGGPSLKSLPYENWLFYSESQQAIAEFEQRKIGKRKPVASSIDGRSRELFERSDLAVYVNVRELRRAYREKLDGFKKETLEFIERLGAAANVGQSRSVDTAAEYRLYADSIANLFQVVDDAEGLTLGVTVREGRIEVEGSVTVAPSTSSDRFVKRNPPTEMKMLGRLPLDKVVYYGMAGDISAVSEWGGRVAATMFKGSEKLQKKYAEARQTLDGLHEKGRYGTFTIANPSEGAVWYTTVTEVDQPEKMRVAAIQLLEATVTLATTHSRTSVTVKLDAERVDAHPVDLVTVKMEPDPFKDPQATHTNRMKMLYGPDGMFTRLSTLPGILVESVGGGKPAFEALMHSLESNQGADGVPGWAAARGDLPAKVNGIILVDLPRLGAEILRVLADAQVALLPLDDAAVTDFLKELHPSYVGIALVTEPRQGQIGSGIRLKIHIPFEQAKGVVKLIEFARRELSVGR